MCETKVKKKKSLPTSLVHRQPISTASQERHTNQNQIKLIIIKKKGSATDSDRVNQDRVGEKIKGSEMCIYI